MRATWTFEQIIPHPIEQVARVLFDVPEGPFSDGRAPLILVGTGQGKIVRQDAGKYVVQYAEGHKAQIFLNKEQHLIALQGQWWYCGEYSLTPTTADTTRLQLNIFNIASRFKWVAALMILPEKKQHQQDFEALAERLMKNLGKTN